MNGAGRVSPVRHGERFPLKAAPLPQAARKPPFASSLTSSAETTVQGRFSTNTSLNISTVYEVPARHASLHLPVLKSQVLVEPMQPPHEPAGVPAVIPDKERERSVNKVKLRFVHGRQVWSPVRVRDDDVRRVWEVVRCRAKNGVPCLGEVHKGEGEDKPCEEGKYEENEGMMMAERTSSSVLSSM